MNPEQELAQWREDWRASTPKEEEQERWRVLEKKVKSQSLRMRLYLVFELLTSLSFLTLALYVSWHTPTPLNIVWAVAVWIFTVFAQGFSLWNQRGIWSPLTQDTRAFVALSLQRCHAILRWIKFCQWLLAAELVFVVVWFSWSWLAHPQQPWRYWLALVLALALSLLFLLFFIWLRKKKQREIASLKDLQLALNG